MRYALVPAAVALCLYSGSVRAQCNEEPPLLNYNGAGQTVCPCFASGEQAGVILDVLGRVVARLADADYGEGIQNVAWDGSALDGSPAPSGVYFARLSANGVESVRKILLAR